jgi:formamidopyrimidine-DNA glycosylase
MPELPEVETVRLGLEPVLRGARFVRVEQRRRDLRFPLPERFAERLTGRKVTKVGRRAKYLLVHLDGGEVLAMHLGMTGRFSVKLPARGRPTPRDLPSPLRGGVRGGGNPDDRRSAISPPVSLPHVVSKTRLRRDGGGDDEYQLGEFTHEQGHDPKHDHVVFALSNGAVITYNDARRFGYMTLIPQAELDQDAFFRGLGVEPLGAELSAAYLAQRALGKKTDLKAFLMDQRIIAGLGNIYVCEALYRARLDPAKPAARLATKTGKPTPAADRLVPQIKAVLADAISAGGSTLRDYRRANGALGEFQHAFEVYGREGEACRRTGCRGRVRRRTQGGRSTFYCPACQR